MGTPLTKEDEYIKKVLREIGAWHVGGEQHRRHRDVIAIMQDTGLIDIRAHYAQRYPEGIPAFEVTELGLETYEEMWERSTDEKTAQAETDVLCAEREWYRENTQVHNWKAARAASIQGEEAKKAAQYAK